MKLGTKWVIFTALAVLVIVLGVILAIALREDRILSRRINGTMWLVQELTYNLEYLPHEEFEALLKSSGEGRKVPNYVNFELVKALEKMDAVWKYAEYIGPDANGRRVLLDGWGRPLIVMGKWDKEAVVDFGNGPCTISRPVAEPPLPLVLMWSVGPRGRNDGGEQADIVGWRQEELGVRWGNLKEQGP